MRVVIHIIAQSSSLGNHSDSEVDIDAEDNESVAAAVIANSVIDNLKGDYPNA